MAACCLQGRCDSAFEIYDLEPLLGKSPISPKLTNDTFKAMRCGRLNSDLPKTFRDASVIAKHFRVRYLWIDALCTLQDSIEDWREEAALMQKVYLKNFCNIEATNAVDSRQGCFVWCNAAQLVHFTIQLPWANLPSEDWKTVPQENWLYLLPHGYVILDEDFWVEHVTKAPLNQRAWILQERILAPRVLHFGQKQVFWECRSAQRCELYPDGLPLPMLTNDREDVNLKTLSELSPEDSVNSTIPTFSPGFEVSMDDPPNDPMTEFSPLGSKGPYGF